jgi:catalase
MYLVAKAADPSVVQGGELAFWRSAGGLGDRAEQYFKDLESGTLRPNLVKGLEAVADNLLAARYNTYKTVGETRLKTFASTLGVKEGETGINLYPAPSITTPIDKATFAAQFKAANPNSTAEQARAAWAAQGGR